jgi:hypothetical protein
MDPRLSNLKSLLLSDEGELVKVAHQDGTSSIARIGAQTKQLPKEEFNR